MDRVILLLAVLALGCNRDNDKLKEVLKKEGTNSLELKNVLQHYCASHTDSLKYKATAFLIENMEDNFLTKA